MYLHVYIETSLSLFDTYIGSVLQYASEIWGNNHGNCVEKVQLHFIRKFKILKYLIFIINIFHIHNWVKNLSTDNCILQQCYQEMLINIDTNNWLSGVRYISLSWFIKLVLAECQFRYITVYLAKVV